jgi:hypothetical protein
LYVGCSDPINTTGRAHIRCGLRGCGPDLLGLSKEELKSITEVDWEWNKYKKLRRPCGLGVLHFGKEVLGVKALLLEIKKAKDGQHGLRGGRSDQQGLRNWGPCRACALFPKLELRAPLLPSSSSFSTLPSWPCFGHSQVALTQLACFECR